MRGWVVAQMWTACLVCTGSSTKSPRKTFLKTRGHKELNDRKMRGKVWGNGESEEGQTFNIWYSH